MWRWKKAEARAAEAEHAAPSPPQPDAPERPSAAAGARAADVTRHALDRALSIAEDASAEGNNAAAARAIRDAIAAANNLGRIEARENADADMLHISRAELEKQTSLMLASAQALQDDVRRTGGPVCTECGRRIRQEIARGERDTAAG